MKRHWSYFKYVARHKYYVALACWNCGVGLWQALLHDWHKFLPDEWLAYARTFYKPDGSKQYVDGWEFAEAWRKHQRRGKHHWQAWLEIPWCKCYPAWELGLNTVVVWDQGTVQCTRCGRSFERGDCHASPMPERFSREMVADWWGAGRAITGKWDAPGWYEKNKANMMLHPNTRAFVEALLVRTHRYFTVNRL